MDFQSENRKWTVNSRNLEGGEVVVVRKSVLPKDYESNKQRMANLEEEIENLKFILSFSGVQSLDMMVEDLESEIRLKLKRISKEFQNFPVGRIEREIMEHLLDHLRQCIKEIEHLLQ